MASGVTRDGIDPNAQRAEFYLAFKNKWIDTTLGSKDLLMKPMNSLPFVKTHYSHYTLKFEDLENLGTFSLEVRADFNKYSDTLL